MFATLAKFWLFLSTIITALTRGASAIDHLAESAELQAEHFKLSKSEENRQSLEALRAKAKQPTKAQPSTSDAPFEL
jgi:hypothetical protein